MLGAGLDTTGAQLAFLLYHLSRHPAQQVLYPLSAILHCLVPLQERLAEELERELGPAGRLTVPGLARCRYLAACQTESQRMVPAIFGWSHRLSRPLALGGYSIPAGTVLLRVGSTCSNDPANFPQPDQFRPERWVRHCNTATLLLTSQHNRWVRGGGERHSAHPFANLPFGHGARACIGQRFARLQLQVERERIIQQKHHLYIEQVLAAKLVQRYRLEHCGPPVQVTCAVCSVHFLHRSFSTNNYEEDVNFSTISINPVCVKVRTRFVSVPDRPVTLRLTPR